jgi:hypothetical protein
MSDAVDVKMIYDPRTSRTGTSDGFLFPFFWLFLCQAWVMGILYWNTMDMFFSGLDGSS